MNYRHVYMCIIAHAKAENRKKCDGNYYEMHHILPKSMFPLWAKKKSNLVLLTAREHFFCHQLLTKIYPNIKMFSALGILRRLHKLTNKEKRQFAKARHFQMINYWKNHPEKKEQYRQKLIIYNKTRNYKHTEETKKKIGLASSRQKLSEDHINALRKANYVKVQVVETGAIFESAIACAKFFNKKVESVYQVLKGNHKSILVNGKKLHLQKLIY